MFFCLLLALLLRQNSFLKSAGPFIIICNKEKRIPAVVDEKWKRIV
jgi:hypothetical protein